MKSNWINVTNGGGRSKGSSRIIMQFAQAAENSVLFFSYQVVTLHLSMASGKLCNLPKLLKIPSFSSPIKL